MNPETPIESLRAEIAAGAARLIAEDGADYASAKRKSARQLLGDTRIRGDVMPDNAQVEEEVRRYNELFLADSQPARLLKLRRLALEWMERLARFRPYLTGAVQNGTAGEHSDIYLQLFPDNGKEVAMFLLDQRVNFEVSETPHFNGHSDAVETLSFLAQGEGLHLALYEPDDLRSAARSGSGRKIARCDTDALRHLIEDTENP
ncbi:MAG: hypothetical protein WBG17_09060 [Burkholderiaceae bacterium]